MEPANFKTAYEEIVQSLTILLENSEQRRPRECVEEPAFLLHAFANRGSYYADQFFEPALLTEGYSRRPPFQGSHACTPPQNHTQDGCECGYEKLTTYVRKDVHFGRTTSFEPVIREKPEHLDEAHAKIAIWYDDRIRSGETMMKLALMYADNPEMFDGIERIFIVTHRDDAGISHFCVEPSWEPSVGHRGFERFVKEKPGLQQHYDLLKSAGIFEKIAPIRRHYDDQLREFRLSQFVASLDSSIDVQALQLNDRPALISYNGKTRKTAAWPDPAEIRAIMAKNNIPDLHSAKFVVRSEKQVFEIQGLFSSAGVPVYRGDFAEREEFFEEYPLAEHMLGQRYSPAAHQLILAGMHTFANVIPRIAGFAKDHRRALLLQESEYSRGFPTGYKDPEENMEDIASWYTGILYYDAQMLGGALTMPENISEERKQFLGEFSGAVVVDVRTAPTPARIIEINDKLVELGIRDVRFVLTHKLSDDGEETRFDPDVYSVIRNRKNKPLLARFPD